MGETKPGNSKSYWILVLFGLPFLGVGIVVSVMGWKMWSLWYESKTWVQVPAIVVNVEFKTHQGDEGGTSYSVECLYTYKVGNRNYSGIRVGLENHGGSSDSYHRARHDILASHRDSKKPIDIWVDPANPERSVVFRNITTTMYVLPMCGLVFGLPGLLISFLGLISMGKARRADTLLLRNPGRPWRADSRWQSFEVGDKPVRRIIHNLAMAIFCGIFVSMFWITMGTDQNAPLFAKVIIFLITLIPVGALVAAVYQTFRYMKYGNPKLVFRQIPFVIGQDNAALLHVKTHISAEKGIELKLQCMKREVVKRGNKSSTEDHEIYAETKTSTEDLAERTGHGSAIPVHFAIPAEQPETFSGDLPNYIWKITAKAATPGIDFLAEFEIPVYHVTDQHLIDVNPMIKSR